MNKDVTIGELDWVYLDMCRAVHGAAWWCSVGAVTPKTPTLAG